MTLESQDQVQHLNTYFEVKTKTFQSVSRQQ